MLSGSAVHNADHSYNIHADQDIQMEKNKKKRKWCEERWEGNEDTTPRYLVRWICSSTEIWGACSGLLYRRTVFPFFSPFSLYSSVMLEDSRSLRTKEKCGGGMELKKFMDFTSEPWQFSYPSCFIIQWRKTAKETDRDKEGDRLMITPWTRIIIMIRWNCNDYVLMNVQVDHEEE